jgi:hypothetical protein
MDPYRPKTKAETKELTHKLLKERCKNLPGADSEQTLRDFERKNQRPKITLRSR